MARDPGIWQRRTSLPDEEEEAGLLAELAEVGFEVGRVNELQLLKEEILSALGARARSGRGPWAVTLFRRSVSWVVDNPDARLAVAGDALFRVRSFGTWRRG